MPSLAARKKKKNRRRARKDKRTPKKTQPEQMPLENQENAPVDNQSNMNISAKKSLNMDQTTTVTTVVPKPKVVEVEVPVAALEGGQDPTEVKPEPKPEPEPKQQSAEIGEEDVKNMMMYVDCTPNTHQKIASFGSTAELEMDENVDALISMQEASHHLKQAQEPEPEPQQHETEKQPEPKPEPQSTILKDVIPADTDSKAKAEEEETIMPRETSPVQTTESKKEKETQQKPAERVELGVHNKSSHVDQLNVLDVEEEDRADQTCACVIA